MRKVVWVIAVFALMGASGAFAQGSFQDLDFEEATLVPSSFGGYSPESAFPGWQLSVGGNSPQFVVLDGYSAGGAEICIFNNNPSLSTVAIQGNYSVVLFSGGRPSDLESVSISQTATVPAGTESIQLDAANVFGPSFIVTLGGAPIDVVSLQSFTQYELWGGNIPTAMAGQPETLTITEPIGTATEQGIAELDNIVFSPNSITVTPEPDPVVLMGIGGALFAAYRRFAPKR